MQIDNLQPNFKKYNPATVKDKAIKLRQQGLGTESIGKTLNVTGSIVSKWCIDVLGKEAALKLSKEYLTNGQVSIKDKETRVKNILSMIKNGKVKRSELYKAFDVTEVTIRKDIREMNGVLSVGEYLVLDTIEGYFSKCQKITDLEKQIELINK